MSDTVNLIARRWSTFHDRGAHDYTDEGCRTLAEHAFRDIPALLARLEAAEARGDRFGKALEEVNVKLVLTEAEYVELRDMYAKDLEELRDTRAENRRLKERIVELEGNP